jgi:hypothetical protein
MGAKGKVIMFAAVSLDGYVANEWDEVGPLLDRYGRLGGTSGGGGKPRPLSPPDRATQLPRFRGTEKMWQGQDSNLCRQCRRFYRPLPLAARAPCRIEGG